MTAGETPMMDKNLHFAEKCPEIYGLTVDVKHTSSAGQLNFPSKKHGKPTRCRVKNFPKKCLLRIHPDKTGQVAVGLGHAHSDSGFGNARQTAQSGENLCADLVRMHTHLS